MRSVNRTSHVFSEFAKKNIQVTLAGNHGELIHAAGIEVDRACFDSAIEHIYHALHYHKFREKFTGNIQIITNGLIDISSQDCIDINKKLHDFGFFVDKILTDVEPEGNNPEVFTSKIFKAYKPH
ncbi:TPA: hypothetical protein ACSP2K_003686 [Aeromonas veronii]|uniref:hypothetical protein n=1 Tax=uncultured Aeromonas sp. TaxID=263763 RepID=UPI002598A6A6|nr:hypothetical protein [uncultured Aeromonas sp.]